MSLPRRVLGVMPKRQITAVAIAGLLLLFTAGGVIGANTAYHGDPAPNLIELASEDINDGQMNASNVESDDVPQPAATEAALENPTLNRLLTPLVKLGFYPAQAGSMLAYWSVGALGQGPTMFWLYSSLGMSVVVPIGHAGRRVILGD